MERTCQDEALAHTLDNWASGGLLLNIPAQSLVGHYPQDSGTRPLTPLLITARADERDRLGQKLAPVYASDGCGADRSRLDAARSAVVSGAAVVPASKSVRGAEP